MEKIVHTLVEADYTDYIYNELGESHDESYTVGDEVIIRCYDSHGNQHGKITGAITEIFVSKRRGIHQLKINNGWCGHPREYTGYDEVIVTKPFAKIS